MFHHDRLIGTLSVDRPITPDTNLALDLGLKSIDLLELVTDVEDTFGIEVSDEAVESIHTAGELDAYIKEMTN